MKNILFSVLSLFLLDASAQMQPNNAHFSNSAEEIASRFLQPDSLKPYVYFLASPQMGGRLTCSSEEKIAAAYIRDNFKSAGLAPGVKGSWYQELKFYRDSVTRATLKIGKKEYQLGKDFAYFRYGIHDLKNQQLTKNEIVFAGYGINRKNYNNYEGISVRNKAVLVLDGAPAENNKSSETMIGGIPQPEGSTHREKIKTAAAMGATILLLNYDPWVKDLNHSGKLTNTSDAMPDLKENEYASNLNILFLTNALTEKLLKAPINSIEKNLQQHPVTSHDIPERLTLELQKHLVESGSAASNVIALLEGTDKKEEYLIITAHYDHKGRNPHFLFPGADDNASGTAALIALARAFSEAKQKGFAPRRSIIFMATSAEESGLWGSQYYVEHPVYNLKQTVANINIDMIGRTGGSHLKLPDSTNYVYVIGGDSLSSELAQINEKMNRLHTQMTIDPTDENGYYKRSDQYNFAKNGIPAIFYTNGEHADYHMPGDTPDKINYELMAQRTRLIFFTAWELANREHRLIIDRK